MSEVKKCWWIKLGDCLDAVMPINPTNVKSKKK